MSYEVWATLAIGLSGTLIGTVSTIVVAAINRQPVLSAAVDSRIAILIDTYERTLGELRAEIGGSSARLMSMRKRSAICAITSVSSKPRSMNCRHN
jgi:hypothetical protein